MEGYKFLYPVARIDLTRPQLTSVVAAGQVIGCVPVFPPADFLDVVRPNFDTLYSIAWLDLRRPRTPQGKPHRQPMTPHPP